MKGFTLIEILVVVAVSVIVMGSFIAYNSVSRAQIALSVEQAKIAQLIFRAKSLTISSYTQDPGSPNVRCGYGVSVDYAGRSYSLNRYEVSSNADCDAIYARDPSADFGNIISPVVQLEIYFLDSNLNFQVPGASDELEDVIFIAPEPKTFLKLVGDNSFVGRTAQIYLETKATPPIKATVSVNSFGQVGF